MNETNQSAALAYVHDELEKIEADERFHYEPAHVQINAPLALIQVGMKARHATLTKMKALLTGSTE